MDLRPSPFTWVTWITGLLSGDKHCRYAAWVRTHYQTTKRPQSDEDEARLRQWAGEHADLVRQRQAALEADGWRVRVEKQNKFLLKGRSTTLSGCPDIVATREVEGGYSGRALDLGDQATLLPPSGNARQALVEDAKTGTPKDSDWWQVAIYCVAAPLADDSLKDRALTGRVAYKDRLGPGLDVVAVANVRERILKMLVDVGNQARPPATPSVSECRFCDIAECDYRLEGADAAVDTEEF